jgi:CheY-like chemotaxis protein
MPIVIFLDLNMPIKDGWEFLGDFTQIPPDQREGVSIYVISSSINPTDRERAQKYDVVGGYLSKPVVAENLQDIIEASC